VEVLREQVALRPKVLGRRDVGSANSHSEPGHPKQAKAGCPPVENAFEHRFQQSMG
jgi:hypothetical protein